MSKRAAFTVSFSGEGLLLNLVVIEGVRAYPRSSWFDYSNAMKRAVKQEHAIAVSGRMDPKCVPSVLRAVKNIKSPRATDVYLEFSSSRTSAKVNITAGRQKRSFVFQYPRGIDGDALLKMVDKIVLCIGQMGAQSARQLAYR